MSKLIQNAVYVPEKDTYLCSKNTHDFQSITLIDDKEFYIDGGTSYIRRGGDIDLTKNGRIVSFDLMDTDPFEEEIVPKLLWGNRGIDGNSPLTYRPLHTYTTNHLRNIIKDCPNISPIHLKVINHILDERVIMEAMLQIEDTE